MLFCNFARFGFLFFAFALMIKADVHVTPRNDEFYSAAVGVLFCSVFVLPVLIIARRLRWPLEEEEEEEEDGDEAEAGADDGKGSEQSTVRGSDLLVYADDVTRVETHSLDA